MSDIIDRSERVGMLNVGIGDSVTIERDSGTPSHEKRVHVTATGISLGLGSTVLVQHDATLALNGLADVSILGKIDIGNGGKVLLNGALNVGVLSNIDFTGHGERAVLAIETTKLTAVGNIAGFGVNDVIRLDHLGFTAVEFTQGLLGSGVLTLYNGSTEVGQIGLEGTYKTSDFSVQEFTAKNGTTGTVLGYVPHMHTGDGGGGLVGGAMYPNYDITGHADISAFGFH
jgi:hypothetical protein